MKSITDTLLVSIDLAIDGNNAVLIVGRKEKPNKPVKIVNAFQGEDATELYKLLTTVKKGEGYESQTEVQEIKTGE